MSQLIALVGRKRSGKDTVADYLWANLCFTRYSFAKPLKDGCKIFFGLSEEQVNGEKEDKEKVDPRWGVSPRTLLQLMGTDIMQYALPKLSEGFNNAVGRSIWVKLFEYWYKDQEASANSLPIEPLNVVITDCRFKHEIDVIKKLGGKIWKIDADKRLGPQTDFHASETEWQEYEPDLVIDSNGTVAECIERLKKCVENM